jgi:gamma-glutamylcyclotransferase (GGCT)/AIG2-like uncharacterized protein YtfP
VSDLLFVYGTLRSEFGNPYARKLRAGATLMGRATTTGSIFRVGSYPGFRPEPAGEVHGELYRLEDPVVVLQALDDYEGPEFVRRLADVSTGASIYQAKAWIYQYEPEPPPGSRIVSGDFCAQ